VVEAQAARVPQDVAQHRAVRRVARRREPLRVPRRLAPVLADLVERVRRCPDRDALGEQLLVRPRVRAARVHPDGEVVDHADRHARGTRRRLHRAELLVEQRLQPGVEPDARREAVAFGRHRGR